MSDYISQQVEAGFATPSEIVDAAVDVFAEDLPSEPLRPIAEELVKTAIEEHMAEQATWPAVTDCDRLDNAFAELEQNGIMCRQNYDLDVSGGQAALKEEMITAAKEGRPIRGGCFFHAQDTDALVEDGSLFLAFSPGPAAKEIVEAAMKHRLDASANEQAAITVAGEIVATLRRHGVDARWGGSTIERIEIPIDWKRRR